MSTLANRMLRIFPIFKSVHRLQRYCRNQNHIHTHTIAKFETKTKSRRRRKKTSLASYFICFWPIPFKWNGKCFFLQVYLFFSFWQIMKLDCGAIDMNGKTLPKNGQLFSGLKTIPKYFQSSTYCNFGAHPTKNNEPIEMTSLFFRAVIKTHFNELDLKFSFIAKIFQFHFL